MDWNSWVASKNKESESNFHRAHQKVTTPAPIRKMLLIASSWYCSRALLVGHHCYNTAKKVQGFLSKTALPPSVCDKSKVHAGQFNSQTITCRAPIKSRLCISDWARPFPRHTQEMFASEWKVIQVSCCCCCFFFKISDTVSFTCYRYLCITGLSAEKWFHNSRTLLERSLIWFTYTKVYEWNYCKGIKVWYI